MRVPLHIVHMRCETHNQNDLVVQLKGQYASLINDMKSPHPALPRNTLYFFYYVHESQITRTYCRE